MSFCYDNMYNTSENNISISEELKMFDKLRITTLVSAAELSPNVHEVTIGPNTNSPKNKVQKNLHREISPNKEYMELLAEDKMAKELRFALKAKIREHQLIEKTDDIFKDLVEKMVTKRAEIMQLYWEKQKVECERKAVELKSRKLQLLKQFQENDNVSVLEKTKLDQHSFELINQQTLKTINQLLEDQNRATARFASITDSHTKICITYNAISTILQQLDQDKDVCEKYMAAISAVIGNINSIMDLCKAGTISDKEVTQAEILALNIENIKQKIMSDITLQKQKLKEQKEMEEVAAKKVEEEKKEVEKKLETEKAQEKKSNLNSNINKPTFYSTKNYQYYEELKNFLTNYEKQYKDLLEDNNMKKFRFECQKAVNTPVNAISSVSGSHMRDKYEKLSKLLRGERVQILDNYVQASQHPQGLAYVTALLAKKIVRQGDLLVSSNSEAAFPLASVTVALWSQFPELGRLLEAYFQKECPYLVPMYLPQKEGQTDKEFYLSRGYTYNEEGVVEKQDKFLKRMSGIFRLRCAIWITHAPRSLNSSNPHSLKHAWRWLASFVNLRPEPDISATLLLDFFTVCGAECLKHYKKQFVKIVRVVNNNYIKFLDNIDEGGPKTRLEVFLQSVVKSGQIPAPPGVLSPNMW